MSARESSRAVERALFVAHFAAYAYFHQGGGPLPADPGAPQLLR